MGEFISYYLFSGIIAFLILLLIYKIRKIESPLGKLKFWIIWIVSSLVVGTIAFIIVLVTFFHNIATYEFPMKPFDSKLWLQDPHKRVQMIDDLIKRKILDKKSEAEIIILLGQPIDSTGSKGGSSRYLEYYLGPERKLLSGIDSEWLDVWFDNDTVKKYALHTD